MKGKICPRCGILQSRRHDCSGAFHLKPLEMSDKAYEIYTVRLNFKAHRVPLYLFNAIKRLIDTYEDGKDNNG